MRAAASRLPRVMIAVLAMVAVVRAQGPDLSVRPIARDGQLLVSFELSDAFSADVRDAIQSGLPTTFSYDIELRRGSSLFDRTVASMTVEASVRFDNLTRRYQMSRTVDGRVEDARPTEDQDAVRMDVGVRGRMRRRLRPWNARHCHDTR